MTAGAVLTVLGIAVAGTAPVAPTAAMAGWVEGQQTTGGVMVVVGWAVLAWGIHRFGRDAKTL
jgi:hypothetical protein